MTRFHFNIRNGSGFVADEEGRELADAEAARAEAVKGARSILADEVLQGRLDLSGRIEVTDGAGRALFAVAYREAVAVTGEA